MNNSPGGACFPPRWCELLVGRPSPLEMCAVCAQCGSTISATRPIVDYTYPYLYGSYTRPAPKKPQITLRRVTPTIPHQGLAKPLYAMPITPLHTGSRSNGNRTGKLRVPGYGYTRGSGRVINNGTYINARCVWTVEQFVTQIGG